MVTSKKNLRTGSPLWLAGSTARFRSRSFSGRKSFDVVVIGAGVSGSLVADALLREGFSVAILDRRPPIRGSTCASTALIQYELDTPLSRLGSRIGAERARQIWQRSFLAVSALRARLQEIDSNLDIVERNSLYLDGDILDAEGLRAEAAARSKAGLATQFLDPTAVESRFGIRGRSGILSFANLAADPVELTGAVLRACVRDGAGLYFRAEVEAVEASRSGVSIHTSRGEFTCASLVFATGYELPKGVPKTGHELHSTWAIATAPQRNNLWPEEVMIWEAADPYIYLRTTSDGRIICGGEDEDFSDEDHRDSLLPAKTDAIREKLAAMFPHVDTKPEHAWCGTFGGSRTGSPSIGRVPRMPNCHAVLGYGGNGITFSMLAGQILANELSGRGDADSGLFSFNRNF